VRTDIRTYSNDEVLVRERRLHIMECAIKLFLDKGYKGTTTREIAKACGMSEGSLYRYIGSKDDILHLICMARAHGAGILENILSSIDNASTPETLKACINACFMWADDSRDYNLFFNREIRHFSPEDRRILLEDQVAIVRFFEKLLIKGVKEGEFQIESPLLVAHDILMKVHDWGLRRWFLRQYFTLEEYARLQTDLILKAVKPDAVEATAENEEKRGTRRPQCKIT
jgi:AcrR family transcriptional regulator